MVSSNLVVLNIVPDARYSGPIRRIIEVAVLLEREYGIRTVLCLPQGADDGETAAIENGVQVVRVSYTDTPRPSQIIKLIKWLILLPRNILTFLNLYRQVRPDLIHVNSAFFLMPALGARIARIPVIWHLNDTMTGPILAKILGFIVKTTANHVAVAALAVGRHYGLNDGESTIIYAPVDVKKFIPASERTNESKPIKISLIANWNRLKGIDHFIHVAHEVNKVYPDVEFHIAGSKLESQKDYGFQIEELIERYKLGPKIILHGFVTSVSSFLEKMHIHVLSSKSEACPITVLEGMAAALPIVATNVGGVCELVSPNDEHPSGLVVPSGDVHAMTKAILELINCPNKAKEFGANGRKRAENLFSLEKCATRHLEVYRETFVGGTRTLAI